MSGLNIEWTTAINPYEYEDDKFWRSPLELMQLESKFRIVSRDNNSPFRETVMVTKIKRVESSEGEGKDEKDDQNEWDGPSELSKGSYFQFMIEVENEEKDARRKGIFRVGTTSSALYLEAPNPMLIRNPFIAAVEYAIPSGEAISVIQL
jgi:hypothetical protein